MKTFKQFLTEGDHHPGIPDLSIESPKASDETRKRFHDRIEDRLMIKAVFQDMQHVIIEGIKAHLKKNDVGGKLRLDVLKEPYGDADADDNEQMGWSDGDPYSLISFSVVARDSTDRCRLEGKFGLHTDGDGRDSDGMPTKIDHDREFDVTLYSGGDDKVGKVVKVDPKNAVASLREINKAINVMLRRCGKN